MNEIMNEIAALRGMDVPALVARYTAEFGKPPRVKHREWLWKKCAHAAQCRRLGGLSKVARARLEELIGEIDLPLGDGSAANGTATAAGNTPNGSTARAPTPGTVLVRLWHGREVRVTVLDHGFEQAGVVYRSLSAVAKAVTGSHWNGRLFFGLKGRGEAS